jgi:formylglycine-generating enzyme required for sulfatase activity
MPRLLSSLLPLVIASSGSAVTMDWTPIGNPGNASDTTGSRTGAVGYSYWIGTYEVANAQYAEFLNAKAASDPLGLYTPEMGFGNGGITRSGSSGSYTYSPIDGRENMPVNHVSFYDALRFANWLNNGQGSGDTETGAYTLLGGTPTPSNGTTVTRNAGATIVLTSEDEWYKAAHYNAFSTSYYDYPASSDTQTLCSTPTAMPNRANCNDVGGNLTIGGSYTGSASPYGTFDQGGNVWEWTEWSSSSGARRGIRGGAFNSDPDFLAGAIAVFLDPTVGGSHVGLRLTMIPEPGTGLLVLAGLLGLAGGAGYASSANPMRIARRDGTANGNVELVT